MKNMRIRETPNQIDKSIELIGWAHRIRSHGKIVFIDLRDLTGILQIVVAEKELLRVVDNIKEEYLIKVVGTIKKRPEKLINPNILTGTIELEPAQLSILSELKADLPFQVFEDTLNVDEALRLEYRYLDLRTERMRNNIIMRANITKFFRDFLSEQDFIEIETPTLTKGTPEGSREYIVPSRIYPGKFFVLPQSPQQYKQLLMISGFEKYFQIARCYRDEDQRGDRQPEFTQLDIEMSFVSKDDVIQLIEIMLKELVIKLYPDKKLTFSDFKKMSYEDAMEKYGTDKPDLRKDKGNNDELAFCWVVDFPLFEWSSSEGKLVSSHHPFTKPTDKDIDKLREKPLEVKSDTYDLVLNGFEIGGGSIRIHDGKLQKTIFSILGLSDKDIQKRFGHLIKAFSFSPPPHGGIALGLDRIVAVLQNEPNIREVIAFPKTGTSKDPLTGAPTELPESTLKELNIKTTKPKA
ncbi:MAG: amino acid--tRNA ligase-related protein [Patescibacteria group bacterium]